MTDFQTVLSRCESCGAGIAPGALFCTRCGFGFADPAKTPPRRLAVDQARSLWGSGGVSAHGPFEIVMASDERPVLWRSDGLSPVLLTSRGARAVIYRLVIEAAGVRPEVVISDLVYETLRALVVTPSGIFAVDGGGMTAARQDPAGGWILNSAILPMRASVMGLASDCHGRLNALVLLGDQFRLYAGRGMTALRLVASGPATDYRGWFDLAISADGAAVFWGGGVLGRIDTARGHILTDPDPRAPSQPLSLNDRGEDLSLHGGAVASAQGATPVSAQTPTGWGLLSATAGRFCEARDDLVAPLAVTGLGGDCSVLFGPAGPTLARIDGGGPLTAIPTGGWGRDVPAAGALAALDDDVLALVNTGSSTDAFLLRTDGAQRSLGLVGSAHFDVGRRAVAAPTPIGSLPPLALAGGVAVGMMLEQLTLWLAPWAEAA